MKPVAVQGISLHHFEELLIFIFYLFLNKLCLSFVCFLLAIVGLVVHMFPFNEIEIVWSQDNSCYDCTSWRSQTSTILLYYIFQYGAKSYMEGTRTRAHTSALTRAHTCMYLHVRTHVYTQTCTITTYIWL